MQKRSYHQACSLAVALDLLGERWTWLIIRALLTGPKRYGELLDQLPGLGTNLLAERLKSLAAAGIISKASGTAHGAYRLSARGEQLRPVAHALIRWGSQFTDRIPEDAVSRPEWDMLAIESFLNSVAQPKSTHRIAMELAGHAFLLHLSPTGSRAVAGHPETADTRISCTSGLLRDLSTGRIDPRAAEADGTLQILGERRGFECLLAMLGAAGTDGKAAAQSS